MFRLAVLALGATVALLVVLALVPQQERTVPGGTIALEQARVTLYPQADPEAVWHFAAERVDYEPDTTETVLHSIEDAARTVGGETDFTLRAARITIDTQENLRSDALSVYVPDVRWTLDMRARGGQPVLIDQQQGKFIAPVYRITEEDGAQLSASQNLRINFDLTDMESGGEGTQNRDSFRDAN